MRKRVEAWEFLKGFTHARIALGRVGFSLPTRELLDFRMAHSRARDSVWSEMEFSKVREQLKFTNNQILEVQSLCQSKKEFVLNPNRGRELHLESIKTLQERAKALISSDCCLVLADGLSSSALEKNGALFAHSLIPELKSRGISCETLVLAKYARVALGDQIGELLKVRSVIVLIGERPGLASPESLSVYFTLNPSTKKTDADRNCISNIHSEGLSPQGAAQMTAFLVEQALKKQVSGVGLKVEYPFQKPGIGAV